MGLIRKKDYVFESDMNIVGYVNNTGIIKAPNKKHVYPLDRGGNKVELEFDFIFDETGFIAEYHTNLYEKLKQSGVSYPTRRRKASAIIWQCVITDSYNKPSWMMFSYNGSTYTYKYGNTFCHNSLSISIPGTSAHWEKTNEGDLLIINNVDDLFILKDDRKISSDQVNYKRLSTRYCILESAKHTGKYAVGFGSLLQEQISRSAYRIEDNRKPEGLPELKYVMYVDELIKESDNELEKDDFNKLCLVTDSYRKSLQNGSHITQTKLVIGVSQYEDDNLSRYTDTSKPILYLDSYSIEMLTNKSMETDTPYKDIKSSLTMSIL